ncbi:hypothetical protein [Paraburkholderia rhynchosiae]|uniref:Uncharacterized protein n=1 Tax=Paraburkholderia rhynchosiae TaxID=487049 RepID=A0A2N7WJZ8_9BURK|nr:hypothetical protein [Paraburkholderia rhynchosiae]PMS29758.1 hypothetical protein C0Z16_17365 [Paraburkholderia rhynchosiae]CAB3698325.1 hypothetical protein LMG27174_03535 [Paraburkholderia rhynchosiae]
MDRRAFMMTSAWLSTTAGTAWPWLAHAASHRDTVAIADSTLAFSAAFARYAAAMNLPTFETGDDIGLLWHTTLAPLLQTSAEAGTASWLIGVTRASDYFVLKELATRATHRVEHSHERGAQSAAQSTYVSFVFAPR